MINTIRTHWFELIRLLVIVGLLIVVIYHAHPAVVLLLWLLWLRQEKLEEKLESIREQAGNKHNE
jgi:hypothetical protein